MKKTGLKVLILDRYKGRRRLNYADSLMLTRKSQVVATNFGIQLPKEILNMEKSSLAMLLGSMLMYYYLIGQKPTSCKENQYFDVEEKACQTCGCNPLGSASTQCDDLGVCKYVDFILVACTRLYTSLCRSVGPSVRRSVRNHFAFLGV